jgi:hypothetical protein
MEISPAYDCNAATVECLVAKYVIRKVDKQGEDVIVDAAKFDALLNRMVNVDPLTYKELQKKPKLRKDGKRKRTGTR